MIKAVVFDLDGTLLYTLMDLHDAVNHAISTYGYKEITLAEARAFVGNGIKKLVERSLKGDTSKLDLCYLEFQKYYYDHCNIKTRKYDGIDDLISFLRENNIKIGVVSNKRYDTLNILVHAHFNDAFPVIIGDGEGFKRKPDPETLIEVARRLDVNLNEMCYIGDSDVDVKTVLNTGCMGKFVDYGFRERSVLEECGAKEIYSSPLELRDAIKREI